MSLKSLCFISKKSMEEEIRFNKYTGSDTKFWGLKENAETIDQGSIEGK